MSFDDFLDNMNNNYDKMLNDSSFNFFIKDKSMTVNIKTIIRRFNIRFSKEERRYYF